MRDRIDAINLDSLDGRYDDPTVKVFESRRRLHPALRRPTRLSPVAAVNAELVALLERIGGN